MQIFKDIDVLVIIVEQGSIIDYIIYKLPILDFLLSAKRAESKCQTCWLVQLQAI